MAHRCAEFAMRLDPGIDRLDADFEFRGDFGLAESCCAEFENANAKGLIVAARPPARHRQDFEIDIHETSQDMTVIGKKIRNTMTALLSTPLVFIRGQRQAFCDCKNL